MYVYLSPCIILVRYNSYYNYYDVLWNDGPQLQWCMHEYIFSSLVPPVTYIAGHNPTLSVEYIGKDVTYL